jgi:hypothetical protein
MNEWTLLQDFVHNRADTVPRTRDVTYDNQHVGGKSGHEHRDSNAKMSCHLIQSFSCTRIAPSGGAQDVCEWQLCHIAL